MDTLLQFIGISLVVVITPGADTALTIRNTIRNGNNAGLMTVVGIVTGQLCWASAASLGLQALVNASHHVYAFLKYCGVAYLFYLGGRSLFEGLRIKTLRAENGVEGKVLHGGSPFREGLLSNLTNPKMLVFFSALLPPFLHGTGSSVLSQFLTLGLIFGALTFEWLTFYILLIQRGAEFVRRPRSQRVINSITGMALMGFAIKVAVERD
jgi:threonine/homoserine/homoserine lactone efflux protein